MREKTLNILKSDNFTKLILIIGFFSLTMSSLVIMKTPLPSGYEISIYEVYPFYFWALIILSILIGQIVLFRYALEYNGRQFWIYGFLLIIIANLILIMQPVIRGYTFYGRGDLLTHIGFIKDILISGNFGSNPYPLDHLLLVFLKFTSSFNLSNLTNSIPVLFSLFFIISMFILAREIFKSYDKVIFTIIFSSILLFGYTNSSFSPYPQSLMILPFVLYLYFKSRGSYHKPEFSILLVILVTLVTFFHPLSAVILIVIFLLIEFSGLLKLAFIDKKISFSKLKHTSSYNIILIASIIFFSWGTYAYLLLKNVNRVFSSFLGENQASSQLNTYSEVLIYGQPKIITLIKTIFFNYGQYILLISMAMLAIFYILKTRKKQKLHFYHIFTSTGFLFFIIAALLTFVSVQVFGFTRMIFITMIFSILLMPILLNHLKANLNSKIIKKLEIGLLCVLIFSITFFSTFNLYASSLTRTSNQHVSKSEFVGMETFFNNRNDRYLTLELGLSNYRFYEAIYGKNAEKIRIFYKKRVKSVGIQDHFGYNNNSFFGSAYKSSVYVTLNTVGENSYSKLYPEKEFVDKWRFNPEDFDKFKNDPSVNLIYQNGDLKVFFTNPVSL